MPNYNLIFYEDTNGKVDIMEFLEETRRMDIKSWQILMRRIKLLEANGTYNTNDIVKKFARTDIWEFRPTKHIRIMFAPISNNNLLMLSAFKKNSKETPPNEIDRAKKRLKEYQQR